MSQPLLNRRYKILDQLGAGGTALVFKAQDLSLNRLVAIKVLRDSLTADAEFLNRFQQEARAAANLAHPNIITIHDFGVDGRYYYIVMEYLEGTDLKNIIRQQAPFSVERFLNFAIQMSAGIGYAHRAGLVHCDVKPQNMLVTPEGRIKVTDFGIARALSTIHQGESHDVVWGSPQYFSPEQAAGEAPTPSSDVYSLGVVFYEMLTGRLPFTAQDPQQLALMHLRDDPPPMTMYNPAVPETLERIVRKVLAKEPAVRYRTADQLGHILISYKEQGGQFNTPTPPRTPTRSAKAAVDAPAAPMPTSTGRQTAAQRPPSARELARQLEEEVDEGLDWTAIGLSVLAGMALLGLLPLWFIVLLRYNPGLFG